jgi:hypothetical protein
VKTDRKENTAEREITGQRDCHDNQRKSGVCKLSLKKKGHEFAARRAEEER